MMTTSSAPPLNLNLRLQEKLDALIQSPAAFAKFVAAENNNATPGVLSQLPSVIPESGDEASNHDPQPVMSAVSPHPIDHSDDEDVDSVANKSAASVSSYKDYSRVLAPNQMEGSLLSSAQQPSSAKEPTFPVKLHMILSNPEFEDIIAWLPHGRSWRILQQKAFEERVIPLYFRHGRYSSFARQVNGWGFRRVTHGSDYNSYYHELFLRGMPHLCDRMRRLTSKDTAARRKAEEDPAPDFYALSRENPLPKAASAVAAAAQQASVVDKSVSQLGAGGSSMFDMEQALMFNRQAGSIANLLGGAPNHHAGAFNPASFSAGINQMQGAAGLQNLMAQQQQAAAFPNSMQGNAFSNLGLSGLQNHNLFGGMNPMSMMPNLHGGASAAASTNNMMMQQAAAASPMQQQQQQQAAMQQFLNPTSTSGAGGSSSTAPQDSMAQLLAMSNASNMGMNPALMGSSFNF